MDSTPTRRPRASWRPVCALVRDAASPSTTPPRGFDPTLPLLAVAGLAGLAAVTGAILWFTDAADHRLAVTLAASGVAATAHEALIHNPCGGRYCPPEPAVRAIVELPDGPRELLLRGSDPETAGLEYDAWSPPPVGSRYHGEITVLYDPPSCPSHGTRRRDHEPSPQRRHDRRQHRPGRRGRHRGSPRPARVADDSRRQPLGCPSGARALSGSPSRISARGRTAPDT